MSQKLENLDCSIQSKPNPEQLKQFIDAIKPRLKENQIALLNLISENIYGFYLFSHEMNSVGGSLPWTGDKTVSTCVFKFEHHNTEGQITIRF